MKMMKMGVTRAAVEFGKSREVITTKMREAGHDTANGHQYTIKQIHEAIIGVGDRDSVKYRREAAEAELAEIDVAKARRDAVSVAEVTDLMDRILQPFRARLLALPATLGTAANPTDPVFGRAAVAAAVDGLLPLLREDVLKAFASGSLETDDSPEDGDGEDEE